MSLDPKIGVDSDLDAVEYESALFGENSDTLVSPKDNTDYSFGDTTAGFAAQQETAPRPLVARPIDTRATEARFPVGLTQTPRPPSDRIPGFSPNQTFADHRLLRLVVSGRLGDVWEAFDPELQCRRAIKIMRPEVARDPRAVELFFRAVRAQAILKHNNVIQILRVGRHENVPYYIAEWVEGETLSQWLTRETTIPVPVAWDIMRQVLLGLSHAYSAANLMHRDVSPDNILVETHTPAEGGPEARRMQVRLMNFGLSTVLDRPKDASAATPAGISHGARPEYVAPEVITGMPVDFPADVYSTGVLLYHMLVGFPPFRGNTRGEIMFKQVHDSFPAVPPMVREGLGPAGNAILKRMTEKLPDQRFSSYKELLEAAFSAPVIVDRRRNDREDSNEYLGAAMVPRAERPKRTLKQTTSRDSGRKSGIIKTVGILCLAAAAGYGVYQWKTQQQPASEAAAPQTVAAAPATEPSAQAAAVPSPAAAAVPVASPVATPAPALPQFMGNELILDDATPGVLKLEPASAWAAAPAQGSHGNSSVLGVADGTPKSATFTADILEQGEYDVFLWWLPADVASRSNKVLCTIYTTSGPFRGTLDQTGSPSSAAFFPVGHYTLPAGKALPIVSISTEGLAPNPALMVSVDALKLVKRSSSPATVAVQPEAAAIAVPVQSVAAATDAEKVIVEAGRSGINNSHYEEISGRWIDSSNPPTAAKSAAPGLTAQGVASTRKYVFGSEGSGAAATEIASARFYPRLKSAGHYHVYVTWPRGGNVTPVNYTVQHAKGQSTHAHAQDGYGPKGPEHADRWVTLGDFDFAGGTGEYVELQIQPGARPVRETVNGQLYADAVCFSPAPLPEAITLEPAPPVSAPTSSLAAPVDTAPAKPSQPQVPGIAGPITGNAL